MPDTGPIAIRCTTLHYVTINVMSVASAHAGAQVGGRAHAARVNVWQKIPG